MLDEDPYDRNNDEDIDEENAIQEEYQIWKKNSPYLYDVLLTHGLEWPSLTINWLPTIDTPNKSYLSLHKMVIGTHTSNTEQEYLMIAKTRLPISEKQLSSSDIKDYNNKDAITAFTKNENKIEIETKINHQGEVNKARVKPQQYNIIATKPPCGEVHIFNYFKHPTTPTDKEVKPELRLQGHTQEGFGLNWSSMKDGYLVSGGNDNCVLIYDTTSGKSSPVLSYINEHESAVNDVCFNKKVDYIFASCSDDKTIALYDYRQEKSICKTIAHDNEVNSIDFCPGNEFILISCSSDQTCALWDLRNLQIKLHSFEHHQDKVIGVKWNCQHHNVFASFSDDRRVLVWDVAQIGGTIATSDNEDGPSELIFTHGGHTSLINDVDWNVNEDLMCASVSEDNVVQIWEMNNDIYYNDK